MFNWFKKKQPQTKDKVKQSKSNRERELEKQDFYDKGYILGWKGKELSPSERRDIFRDVKDKELYNKFQEGYKAGKKEGKSNPFGG